MSGFDFYNAYGLGDVDPVTGVTLPAGWVTVDCSSLIAAFAAGRINPTFSQYQKPGISSTGYAYPLSVCVDDATANQIASLLGKPVVTGSDGCPSITTNGPYSLTSIAQLAYLNVPADLGQSRECALKYRLDTMYVKCSDNATCDVNAVGWPSSNDLAVWGAGQSTAGEAPLTGVQGAVGSSAMAPAETFSSAMAPAGSLTTSGGTTVIPAGGSTGATGGGDTTGGASTSGALSILTETSIGSIPNWVWLAGAAAALFAFSGGSK